jgi:diguanylate cyclase (GGDEF)-like protein
VRVARLLPGRIHRRLLGLSLLAAAAGSAALALVSAALVLGQTTRQAEQVAVLIERDLITSLTSFQPIYEVQRQLQLKTASGQIRQALVVDQRGRVIAASDQALVGQLITTLATQPMSGTLAPHLRDCAPQAEGLACLDQQLSLFDGPLPWVSGEHLVRFTPTPLALAGGSGFAQRATLILDVDLLPQLLQTGQLALRLFATGLLPLFVTCAALALEVRRRLLPELLHLAQRDALSGVLNRRAFLETAAYRLERAASLAQPAVVALIDVDHFKQINDTFGHAAGDAVIQAMATLLEGGVRRSDLVGRLGGDEFALLIESAPAQARELLERLRSQVARAPIALADGGQVPITLSIGMASSDGGRAQPLEALLADADASLYLAKDQGRDRVMDLSQDVPRGWRVGGV